jgi:hypothetical protein
MILNGKGTYVCRYEMPTVNWQEKLKPLSHHVIHYACTSAQTIDLTNRDKNYSVMP